MGGTSYSASEYKERDEHRKSTGKPVFAHHEDVRAGRAAALHPSLDIKNKLIRESRDSDVHPTSRAVAVLLDVTGSMANVPKDVQKKLPLLMGMLITKSYIEHPHVLIGAVGDAHHDIAPIQMGQFEAGIEIDDNISNLFLEGGGGGSGEESYELSMYYLAEYAAMDCLEKRGEKGYLFLLGDERPYTSIPARIIKKYVNDNYEGGPVALADIVAKLLTKFEVFFINPANTSHYRKEAFLGIWKNLLGERVLFLEDPNAICELIASTIAMCEGVDMDEIDADLTAANVAAASRSAIKGALMPLSSKVTGKTVAIKTSAPETPSGLAKV